MKVAAFALALGLTGPALAADRTISVTDFDRVRVTGAMSVIVTQGRVTSVHVRGAQADVETIIATVSGQQLSVTTTHFGWGSSARAHGPITVYVSTPQLRAASLTGSGRVEILSLRAARLELGLSGAGDVTVHGLVTERLAAGMAGSGRLTIDGSAAQAQLSATGSGVIDAPELKTRDLKVAAQGAVSVNAFASRTAAVNAGGSGQVVIDGHPSCTVNSQGSGTVSCGR